MKNLWLSVLMETDHSAIICDYPPLDHQESWERTENSNFLLFGQKDPFGKQFLKNIVLSFSSEFNFLENLGKLEIHVLCKWDQRLNNTWNSCKISCTFNTISTVKNENIPWLHFNTISNLTFGLFIS